MKNLRIIFMVSTVCLIGFIAVFFFSYGGMLNFHNSKDIEQRMEESVEPNIVSFVLQMEEQIKKVKTFAAFLEQNWDVDQSIHESLLLSAVENNGLLRCAIAYPDGSFITHDKKNEGNVSKDAFFIANMQGDFYITDPRPAVVDQTKSVILFSAPIFELDGSIKGAVIYSYLCNDMDKIFNLKAINGGLNMAVAKKSGELLIGSSEFANTYENLLDSIANECSHKQHKITDCVQIKGESGTHRITQKDTNEMVYVRYDKLGYNDWHMVTTIPESVAGKSMTYAAQNQRRLSMIIAAGVAVYLTILLLLWFIQRKLVDTETGAFTLYAFEKESKKIFKHRKDDQYVVVKLDIKDFKLINRIHSHAMGDKVIKCFAQALTIVLSDVACTFARVSVDSFVLLLPYRGNEALNHSRQEFIDCFRRLLNEKFATKIIFPTGQYVLKESDFPKPDMSDIFEKVNFAHSASKQKSDVIIDYEEDVEQTALFEKQIEDRMEDAIANEEFTLYLQPKIRLLDESLCGAEALVRWEINGKYYTYPNDFVPILERNGFIVQLDKYMFRCAAKYISEEIARGVDPMVISVNFSRHHLGNPNFVDELCQIADEYHVPHQYLEIELTESAFLGQVCIIKDVINQMHAVGFRFSMDDFGNGYSCFAQLKELEIDVLKIDRGFFIRSDNEQRARIVIEGVFRIAQELNITTVAEGIEEKAQIDMLKELGCDMVQGFYYAKPMPAAQLDSQNFEVNILDL